MVGLPGGSATDSTATDGPATGGLEARAPAISRIYRVYEALSAGPLFDRESGLGGKLLYAGDVASRGKELLFAANIAGAASLAASADPAVQRQAIREAVVDFVVTSLEEALRILKNEIRKHLTVSVAVAAEPRLVEQQMLDRGVLADLLPPANWGALEEASVETFLSQGGVQIGPASSEGRAYMPYITWSVNSEPSRWLPRLDLCAQTVLPADDAARHRWLRLAPRYLGRLAQRQHGVALDAIELQRFRDLAKELVRAGGSAGGEPVLAVIEPAAEQV